MGTNGLEPFGEWKRSGGGQGRGRTADLPIFSRTLVPTELPGRLSRETRATPTGLEPATSAVTGRRANQLRYGALLVQPKPNRVPRAPNGIRTRAAALKGRSPRPLDDGDLGPATSAVEGHFMVPEACKTETAPIPYRLIREQLAGRRALRRLRTAHQPVKCSPIGVRPQRNRATSPPTP